MVKKTYGTKWIKFRTIGLGSFWAYVIGIVEDVNSGEKKIRIAKGKVKGIVQKIDGKFKYKFSDPNDPITQVNRLNIKTREEWEKIKKFVEEYFDALEKYKNSDMNENKTE